MEKLDQPQNTSTEYALGKSLTKVATGYVPIVGPLISELVERIWSSPAEQRMADWQATVVETINILVEQRPEDAVAKLADDENFQTVLAATTETARKTVRRDKIEMLRATLLNAGSGVKFDAFILNTFLNLVDRYTPEHLYVLRLLADQEAIKSTLEAMIETEADVVKHSENEGAYAKVEDIVVRLAAGLGEPVASEVFSDLHRDALARGSEGFAYSINQKRMHSPISKRGIAFLKFVSIDDECP